MIIQTIRHEPLPCLPFVARLLLARLAACREHHDPEKPTTLKNVRLILYDDLNTHVSPSSSPDTEVRRYEHPLEACATGRHS